MTDEDYKRSHKLFNNFDEAYDFYKKFNKLDIPYIYEIDRLMDELSLVWKNNN